MKKKGFLFSVILIIVSSCVKDPQDPFFESFPKKYLYESVEKVSSVKLYTDGKEIMDNKKIFNFIKGISFFESSLPLEDSYKNDIFIFENNTLIKYTGHNNYVYDSLYYTKVADRLMIKTKSISSFGNAFNYKDDYRRIFSWKIDSISYLKPQIGSPISTYAYNMEFRIINNKMHIPVLCYYYKKEGFSIKNYRENVFNEKAINELNTDTLGILEYIIKFTEQ